MKVLSELLRDVAGAEVIGDRDCPVAGISFDSRTVRPGYLFAALPGTQSDGWSHLEDARQRGAVCVLGQNPPLSGGDLTIVQVPDARIAAAQVAAAYYDHPSRALEVIGVTGTNGKTTVAYMVRAMLEAADRMPAMFGTVEYSLGERTIPAVRTTPDASDLQRMLAEAGRSGCRSVVMEVSSHAVTQQRAAGIAFDAAVFTNLTREHLDYHESMERYFQAKADFLRAIGRDGNPEARILINVDDAWGARLVRSGELSGQVTPYGESDAAALRADDVVCSVHGSRFEIHSPWGSASVVVPIPGRFNVSNALASIGVCAARGVPLDVAVAALAEMPGVPGRLEEITQDHPFQVYVDYAHTDDALEQVLGALRELTTERLIVVFGCGGDRDRSKRAAMGRVAARLADHAVLTSDNPRSEPPEAIIDQIAEGFNGTRNYEIVESRREAIRRALELAREGDIVLVAGKGHENFQEIGPKVIPFDDRDVIRDLL